MIVSNSERTTVPFVAVRNTIGCDNALALRPGAPSSSVETGVRAVDTL